MKRFWKWLKGSPAPPGHPHNWKAGLKRAWQVHLPFFGGPSVLATLLIPPGPWKWAPAAALVAWRSYGEYRDWKTKQDTGKKALIDFSSQCLPAILTAIL